MRTVDIAWAAGFLEGEGSFQKSRYSIRTDASQVQREPLERLQKLFGGPIYRRYQRGTDEIHTWAVHGQMAASIMMTLYVLMSPKRQRQILKCLGFWKTRRVYPRTHCPQGHEYEAVRNKQRRCKICCNEASRKWAKHNPEKVRKRQMAYYYRQKAKREQVNG